MADVTPPVALAAFAAAAISRADPIKTGVQAFFYEIRTAILPVVFIFNPELLLIGVTSIWHGIMVFIVSLIAILCFSSMTQNYMLVRNKWYEGILLGFVMVGLFRPDVYLDRVYPAFSSLDLEKFVAGEVTGRPGYAVRIHVTSETEYGDRYRLYRMVTPELGAATDLGLYGVKIVAEDGRFIVDALQENSIAANTNLQVGDVVTEVDAEQSGRPAKEVVYPIMLLILGFVILLQVGRLRRQKAAEAT